MSELTPDQRATFERRTQDLLAIHEEIVPFVAELADLYGITPAPTGAVDFRWLAEQFEEPLKWETYSTATPEHWEWIAARLMMLVGQFFVTQWAGKWRVQGDPTKPYFLDIVIDQFESVRHHDLIISPLSIADFYMNSAPDRNLARMLADRSVYHPDG
jgi:hypothetical protein